MKRILTILLLISICLIGFSQSQPHMMHALASQDSGSEYDLLTGLISCWEMDDGSGSTLTDANGNYDLTLVGNPTWGIKPNCIIYDGDDYATAGDIGDALNPSTAHSISVWFRKNGSSGSISNHQSLFSRYWSQTSLRIYYFSIVKPTHETTPNWLYWVYYDTGNNAGVCTWNPGYDIWLETWHHVVATRIDKTMKLYVDGVLKTTATDQGNGYTKQNTNTSVDNLSGAFSKSTSIPDSYFKGNVGQTAVWNVALTADQVTALYNEGNGIAYNDF